MSQVDEPRVLDWMLVTLRAGRTYVAEQAWETGEWLHLANAQEKADSGRLNGRPGAYVFPRELVDRVQPATDSDVRRAKRALRDWDS